MQDTRLKTDGCQQHRCERAAKQIVHWPGQDTRQCDEHTAMLQALAETLGFALSCTPIVKDGETP